MWTPTSWEYTLFGDSRAAGRRLDQLSLPDGVVVSIIAREDTLIPPRGSTQLRDGDHAFVVLRAEVRPLVARVFSRDSRVQEALPILVEFPLMGSTTVADMWEFYGIRLGMPGSHTLNRVVRKRLGDTVQPGTVLEIGQVTLHVREVVDGRVTALGLAIGS